jgi:hypothetical protein
MTGTSLSRRSYPCIIFLFLHMYDYAIIDSGHLMIGLFSVFEVIKPQGNYIEKLYDPDEYKLT